MQDSPPPTKRIRLESSPPQLSHLGDDFPERKGEEEDVDNQCSICLQQLTDRALIPRCSHEFCFECLVIWADQSRRCPLCAQGIGEYLIHHIRSRYDYTKYFLLPLRGNSPAPRAVGPSSLNQRRSTRRERQWGQRERREQELQDRLERSIRKRKWVYRHHLYAKHVASNIYTRYRPFPTPAQFAVSSDYISRATSFLRRELQVWPNLDIEFLITFTLSIMKALDIRSESAVKLLSEFLDMDQPYVEGEPHPYAEHFAHEMYSYLRSPFRDLYVYDKMVQYDEPEDFPVQTRRNDTASRPLSPSRRNSSLPRRPDGDHNENRRQMTHGISDEGRRKRGRSRSHNGARALHSRDPSVGERISRRDGAESQTRANSSEPSSPSPRFQVVKGKGKAVDLGRVVNDLGPSTSGSEAERVTIDKGATDPRIHGFPNAEHTVIGDSKVGNRDRAPKVLTLRQSVRAHLSLPKTEPVKVSGPNCEPENRIPGPGLRHGHPSLLERVSGMEETLGNQAISVSAVHPGVSASPYPSHSLRPVPMRPQRSTETSIKTNPTEEGSIDVDNQCADHIAHDNNVTAHADRPDRAPRVDTDDRRTHVRLGKMKNVTALDASPTTPASPPIPPVSSASAGPGETTFPAPVVGNLRRKLLERLEGERNRAIGAASGELEVERVAGNAGEDSLRAELRARNRLRARLAVAEGDRHVDILEPLGTINLSV